MTRVAGVPAATVVGRPPVCAALLVRKPIQHFIAGLRLLAAEPDVRCRVYYWDVSRQGSYDPGFARPVRWHLDLHSGYDWWAPTAAAPAGRRATALWRQLWRDRPEVILSFGWASPAARLGISFATITGTPLLLYGDSNWRAAGGGPWAPVRRRLLGGLFRRAAGAVSTGAFNREFYIFHGMHPATVHPGVYPTDVESFHAAAGRRQQVPADPAGPVVIGFAGKFLAAKAPEDLIEAAARLPRRRRWELRLIGDGPLRSRLERLVADRGLGDRVRFLGFRNCDELPELMSGFDIVVMPSRREPRGLVPVEGMAAGAAAVVSSATGVWGPGDVVQDGESGLVYPAGDVAALTACLGRLIEDPSYRRQLAVAGQARALRQGPRQFATLVARAVTATVGGDRDVPVG